MLGGALISKSTQVRETAYDPGTILLYTDSYPCEGAVENFAVKDSNLPPLPSSIRIDRLYIEGGASGVAGAMVSVGVKDKPVRMSRSSSFKGLLEWVDKKPVVLYDTGGRRAWLLDGASALLYLVRVSIESDRHKPMYRSTWKFHDVLRGGSAIEILSDFDNLSIKLFVDNIRQNESGVHQEVFYTFHERVLEILRNIETLLDYQVQAAARDGYSVYQTGHIFKKTMIGFHFWDVVKPDTCVSRRYHGLEGFGWVDYIRSIGAMVIFGNGLGSLIQAAEGAGLCPNWGRVPIGRDLMCASVTTLKKIQKAQATFCGPGELTSDILWSSCYRLPAPCQCVSLQPGGVLSHVDPVQVLLPKRKAMRWLLQVPKTCVKITLSQLGDSGAVVFGNTPYKFIPRLKHENPKEQVEVRVISPSSAGSSESQAERSIWTPAGEWSDSTSRTTPQTSYAELSGDALGDGCNLREGPVDTGKRKREALGSGRAKRPRLGI